MRFSLKLLVLVIPICCAVAFAFSVWIHKENEASIEIHRKNLLLISEWQAVTSSIQVDKGIIHRADLNVSLDQMSQPHVDMLCNAANLKTLVLWHQQSDSGLSRLSKMNSPCEILVPGSVSDDGFQRLQNRLASCRVLRTGVENNE